MSNRVALCNPVGSSLSLGTQNDDLRYLRWCLLVHGGHSGWTRRAYSPRYCETVSTVSALGALQLYCGLLVSELSPKGT